MLALLGGVAFGASSIAGLVTDRNGTPLSRVRVSLTPGNVELVTDREGRFLIDYLRDEAGERVKLARRTEYELEVFKPGFHAHKSKMYFKRGEVVIDTILLLEESILVEDVPSNLDAETPPTQTSGATYEGQ